MTKQTIRSFLTPFNPFMVKLSNGDFFFIPHTDFLLFLPEVAGELIVIVDSGGGVHLIDVAQIVSLDRSK